MPKVEFHVDHNLGREEALRRIKEHGAGQGMDLARRYGGEYNLAWNGYVGSFTVRAQGQSVSGEVVIEDRRIVLRASIPLMLLPLKGMVERMLHEQAKQILK